MNDTSQMRRSYERGGLGDGDVGSDPMELFRAWLDDAIASGAVHEPNAMTLATASPEGTPSARMVLLKGIDPARAAFRFFTGRASRKGRDLLATHRAALVFWWEGLERQVRVVGDVVEIPRDEVAAYFATRPHDSQLGAAASSQSVPVDRRDELDARMVDLAGRYPDDTPVPVPDDWTGFEVIAQEIEFWHGRAGRLHDRFSFRRLEGSGTPVLQLPHELEEGWRTHGTRVEDEHGTTWLRCRLQP